MLLNRTAVGKAMMNVFRTHLIRRRDGVRCRGLSADILSSTERAAASSWRICFRCNDLPHLMLHDPFLFALAALSASESIT